jgi:hypothetical protein
LHSRHGKGQIADDPTGVDRGKTVTKPLALR